jgi:hypothetical protein
MNLSTNPKIGLVDPVRTAQAFVPELERRNIPFVIVESGLVDGLCDLTGLIIPATPTIEMMAEQLRKLRITQILGCIDPSITYADRLCAQLGLPFNGLRLSEARRNKVLMNDAINKAHLRTPFQFETDKLEDLLAWLKQAGYPVVIKPVSSGGTDNVYFCDSNSQVIDCFHKIYGSRNLMGQINTSVLAQEYIDGIEYAIDCVSFNGIHTLIDVFQYQKGTYSGRAFVYEKERFLRAEDPTTQRLWAFAQQALDALEFRTGASHMEVKINSKDEIVFIEVGPRLSGDDTHKLVQVTRADGKSQMEYTIDAVLGESSPDPLYQTAQEGVRVHIVSKSGGRLKGLRYDDKIKSLSSYTRMNLHVEIGGQVAITTDMTNGAGWIDLSNADAAMLQEDERQLDAILRDGILILE